MNNINKIKFPIIYNNGNYQVKIENDGTKTRTCLDDKFEPRFPETIDLNISNYCEHNCEFCYISASINGKHGNLNLPIFDDIKPGMELAINYAKHPSLFDFLLRMQEKKVIVNMTINQMDFENGKTTKFIEQLLELKLITALGVSVNSIDRLPQINFDNVVYHVIVGLTPIDSIKQLIKLKKKILFLGYKTKGRGKNIIPNIEELKNEMSNFLKINESILSFDNLALEQLSIIHKVSKEVWKNHYMGEEGQYSMYIDSVSEKFFKSSTEVHGYDLKDKSLKEIFKKVNIND